MLILKASKWRLFLYVLCGDYMSKILTIPSSIDEINKTKSLVDGFIIGVKDMCVNTNMCIDNLDILNEFNDKDIFIRKNKRNIIKTK